MWHGVLLPGETLLATGEPQAEREPEIRLRTDAKFGRDEDAITGPCLDSYSPSESTNRHTIPTIETTIEIDAGSPMATLRIRPDSEKAPRIRIGADRPL